MVKEKVNYYFLCACGCGQMSEKLGKDYIRLRKSQKWYTKECAKGKDTSNLVQDFKGGVIFNEPDF